jgi:2'-5' RNA ligase
MQAIETLQQCDLGPIVVHEVSLFRSELKPDGADYTLVATVPLA